MTSRAFGVSFVGMLENRRLFLGRDAILRRVAELAVELKAFCSGGNCTVVWLEKGAGPFARDFLAALGPGVECVPLRASSYGGGTDSSGTVDISGDFGRIRPGRVVLLDDILDTGLTAAAVCGRLQSLGFSEIRTCFLLEKKARRLNGFAPDHVGFEVPDVFVFGYGMDIDGDMRGLPGIYFLEDGAALEAPQPAGKNFSDIK